MSPSFGGVSSWDTHPRLELREASTSVSLGAGFPNRELPPKSPVLSGKWMQKARREVSRKGATYSRRAVAAQSPATRGQELEMSRSRLKAPKGSDLEGPEVVPGLHAGSHTPRVDLRLSPSPHPESQG